jgi:acyl-CoA synthetase (AMP-forming)/AMP-acid ligase II
MITTGEILARNARKFPEREGLVFEDKRYTYAALNEAVNRLAGSLMQMGLEKGEKVGILSLNSDSFVISYFAVMKAGGIVVPLNYRLAPPEAFYILDNSDSRFFIVGEEFLGLAMEIRERLPMVEKWIQADGKASGDFEYLPDLIASGDPAEPAVKVGLFDESAIIYTAGTAGKPKGAVFNHYSHLSIATAMLSELAMRETDRILHTAPLYDAADLHLFLWPGTFVGATHVVMREFIPEAVLKTIQEEKITHFFGASTMYLLLMQEPSFAQYDLGSLRYLAYGAAPLNREQVVQAEEMFATNRFFCFCGLTEGGPGGVRLRPEDQVAKAGTGGLPIINCESRVVDDAGNDVAAGEMGEWMVRCESNMLHYYNNPGATAETLTADGWLHTDDMAIIDDDGYVTLVDRKTEVVVTGGEKVYPREVEMALLECPGVMDVAVVGQPDEIYGETIKAFVVPLPDAALTDEGMLDFCRGKLGDFKIPTAWEFVDVLPRNPSGKLQKYMLRDM